MQRITRKERSSETLAGLFTSTIVEIPKLEYTELIRESEQNDTIRRLLQKNKYVL